MFILMALFIQLFSNAATPPPGWVYHARQLLSENQATRDQAVMALNQAFRDTAAILPEIEGPYRNYALDVIVALKFQDAVGKLLPKIEEDRDGAVTLAINALMDDHTFRPIAEHYMRFLEQRPLHSVAVPVLLAVIDYFTHLRFRCEETLFAALLTHPRLEVQQAAALHFAVLNNKKLDKLILKNFAQLYPQVRAQVVLTFHERKVFAQIKKICGSDGDPIVKSACQGLDFKDKREKRGKRKTKRK